MSQALTEFKISRIKGVLSNALTLKDRALLLEKEVGLEPFYAMLAMGQTIGSLAVSIDMSIFELEYMLTRTNIHRKQYMNAVANKLARDSSATLGEFKNTIYMDTEHAAAARHHSTMLDRALKHLNAPDGEDGGSKIVVNNTVVVRGKDEVPPLPDGLNEIIEGEYADIEP